MMTDLITHHWDEISPHARQWWGELSEDDMEEINGHRDRLSGLIQRRYGRTRDEAETDINRFLVRASRLFDAY